MSGLGLGVDEVRAVAAGSSGGGRTVTAPGSLPMVDEGDEEPVVGSVVLDRDGDAWQRRGDGWFIATALEVPLDFEGLHAAWGPLWLLFEPDDEPVEPQ